MTHRAILTPLDGEERTSGTLALTTPPPSLNNAFVNGAKGRFKSPAYKAWTWVAQADLRNQSGWHVPGRVRVCLLISRADTKADLDNLIKPVLDLLVAAGRIADDRNVVSIEAEFADILGVRVSITASPSPQQERAA